MSKFGKTEKAMPKTATVNKEGGKAFKPSEKLELVLRAATTLGKTDGFYESACESDRKLVQLVHSVAQFDPEFVLKTAWYTRNRFNLRTPATVILAEAARSGRTADVENAKRYFVESIKRVDDMTELVSYCIKMNAKIHVHKGKIPMVVKRALANAFGKFDEYQFAKYTKQEMFVTPQDIMFMVHPKPESRDQKRLFAKIVDDILEVPMTWEDYIRENGSTRENWQFILDKMGYMGVLRNLRNLVEKGVDVADIEDALVGSRDRVIYSRQLPFRFYSAYRALENAHSARPGDTGRVMAALSKAMDISAENLRKIEGTTAVFCDNSGSMRDRINPKSSINYSDIGNVFGAVLANRCSASVVATYGTDAKVVNINPVDSILTNTERIAHTSCGGGNTFTYKCIDLLDTHGYEVDRMIFFTDEQGYGRPSAYDRLNQYRRKTGTNPFVYSFDLKHYGTTQFPENEPRHATIGGWSDNILKFITLFERDRTKLTDDIERVVVAG